MARHQPGVINSLQKLQLSGAFILEAPITAGADAYGQCAHHMLVHTLYLQNVCVRVQVLRWFHTLE